MTAWAPCHNAGVSNYSSSEHNEIFRIWLCRGEGDRGLGAVVDSARHVSQVIWSRLGHQDLPEAIVTDTEQLRTYQRAAAMALAVARVNGKRQGRTPSWNLRMHAFLHELIAEANIQTQA